jgi:hypothetical protein
VCCGGGGSVRVSIIIEVAAKRFIVRHSGTLRPAQ